MRALENIITFLILVSAALYFVSTILLFMKNNKNGKIFLWAGWCTGIVLFIFNWIAAGYPPLANMYHVMTFLSLCFLPLFLLITYNGKMKWILPYFSLGSMLPLVGVMFMERGVIWKLAPALQAVWFVPHVLSYMISYALAAVAFILTLSIFARTKIFKSTLNKNELKQDYLEAIYNILRLGMPFMTFGIFLGALWAEEAWGVYWSWDSKETWSLITWTFYLIYFHSLRSKTFKKWATAFQILGFASLLITFFGVNYLPQLGSILHSYAR